MDDKELDRKLDRMLRESGREQAPEGLNVRVMERIRALETVPKSQAPLISSRGWIGIAAATALLLFWASRQELAWSGDWLEAGTARLSRVEWPVWELPQSGGSLLYAGVALALFAGLHLAWMRRYLGRRASL